MEVYAAQVTAMDRGIGRIVEALQESGRFDDTLVLFTVDNGGCHVEYEPTRIGTWTRELTTDGKEQAIVPGNIPGIMPGPQTTFQSYGYGWANASNTPFREFKQFDHEGGTRSPLVVCWPDGIAGQLVGRVSAEVGHAIDIMPTFLAAAGVEGVEQKPMAFEGRSLLSALNEGDSEHPSRDALFWAHSQGRGIRAGDWKLVTSRKNPWQLYNLVEDGTELHDLAAEMPEKVAELEQRHSEWDQRTNLGSKNKKK
jgi:arylsulfatase A-like enzyme